MKEWQKVLWTDGSTFECFYCKRKMCSSHNKIKDLFSLVNQCPCQAIRPHTDQSAGRVHWFHLSSKELCFLALFWKSWSASREYPASREERPLSCPHLLDAQAWAIFAEDNCWLICDTQRTLYSYFSHSDTVQLSVIIINLFVVLLKRVFFLFCATWTTTS